MRSRLLRCLATAVAKNGVKFLCGLVPGGDVLFDIANDAWQDYCQGQQENILRAEVQGLAQASADEVQKEVEEAVRAGAAGLPDDARQKLTAYLGQVPGMIRRSLRRPSDPTGTTVPANLPLRSPEDLLPFLPPRPPRFQPGMRPLPGVDWVLEEPLGVGGFGEVWKARHAHLRSKPPVALKFCLDPSAAPVLRNEAGVLDRVMQQGRLPGIVPLLQTYLTTDPPCLEYEYVEGGDLAGLVRELHAQKRLTPDTANRLLLQLAEIVAAAHRADPAIVHDDLKPSNVLVRRGAAGQFELHVTDFGIGGLAIARAVRETRRPTQSREELLTEAVRGAYTPLYASPEQMARRRGEAADPRDDVHALGVIWYQLLTGDLGRMRVPADWREEVRRRGLSEALTGLLGACLSRAEKRPDSAEVLARRLRELLTPKRRRVHGRALVLASLAVLLATAVIAFAFWASRPTGVSLGSSDSGRGDPAPTTPDGRGGVSPPFPDHLPYTNSIGMKFGWVPPCTFTMGSPPGEAGHEGDEIAHKVTLTKGYYMGAYLVTQEQWERVMGKDANHSYFMGKDDAEKKVLPVDCVSWKEGQEFCTKLSALDGRTYQLPTEAQWERACRAGTQTAYFFGDAPHDLGKYAWFEDNSDHKTHAVGTKEANPWGLYDVHGNLWQWCQDVYAPYPSKDIKDPLNDDNNPESARVVRGGSWYVAEICRAAYRDRDAPGSRDDGCGLRVCFCLD